MQNNRNNINMEIDKNWKKESQSYLNELQKFLDKASNIQNQELKEEIIIQMLKCDDELTKLAEENFKKYYEQGRKC